MTRFYRVMHAAVYPFVKILFPFDTKGLENVPKDRPVLLCGNHAHAADPFLVALSFPGKYPLRVMAKKELMDTPVLGFLLKKAGIFGVDRGHSDLGAVKTAIKTIKDGGSLVIFPEGTRVKYEGEVQPKGGVAMIALRTGAPMIPVYVGGRHKFLRRTHVIFGEPYEPQTETRHGTAEEYQAFADELMRRAYALGREQK